jgi:hypothetical protein
MGQDCNQRKVETTFFASIHLPRTGLFASETAIIRSGLQSIAAGQDYLQLTKCLMVDANQKPSRTYYTSTCHISTYYTVEILRKEMLINPSEGVLAWAALRQVLNAYSLTAYLL